MISINGSVGYKSNNDPLDVENIINLLSERKNQSKYSKALSEMYVPSLNETGCIDKLTTAIKYFQRNFQKLGNPDGVVSPNENTILFLGGVRSSDKTIIVDLDKQNLYAYSGSSLAFDFYCTSGDSSHPTATWPSLHKIMRKYEIYRSRTYDAQMNYAMFFTYDGKAIHQSHAVGVTTWLKSVGINAFGSHGCVRLSEINARMLFNWTPMGTPVFIDLEKL